jgi:hypothetical protein
MAPLVTAQHHNGMSQCRRNSAGPEWTAALNATVKRTPKAY